MAWSSRFDEHDGLFLRIGLKVFGVYFDEIAALELMRAGRNLHTKHLSS
jgi:hypothetical protein